MTLYRTRHVLEPTLPDDRLVSLTRRDSGLLVFSYRQGFADEGLVHDFDELSRHLAQSTNFSLEDRGPEDGPSLDIWMDQADLDEVTLMSFKTKFQWHGSRLEIGLLCRSSLIRDELLEEMNNDILPVCMDVLHLANGRGKL